MKSCDVRAMGCNLFTTEDSLDAIVANVEGMVGGEAKAATMALVMITINTTLEQVARRLEHEESQVATQVEFEKLMKSIR